MIQKKSWLNVSDNTNVNWLQDVSTYTKVLGASRPQSDFL